MKIPLLEHAEQPAFLHVTLGATLITWLPYIDMGLRIVASMIAIYSGILYVRKLRKK